MDNLNKVYCELKKLYAAKYKNIFLQSLGNTNFQKANQAQRIDIIRKTRYLFLMSIINSGVIHAADAEKCFPLCFSRMEATKAKELSYTPDKRQFVYNPYKN